MTRAYVATATSTGHHVRVRTLRRVHPAWIVVVILLAIAVLFLALRWKSHQDNVAATARHGEQITDSIPGIAAAFGKDSVGTLREDSCNGSPDPKRASRNTRWQAGTGKAVSSMQDARDVARSVREEAEAQGWTSQDRAGAGPNHERLYFASRGDLHLIMDVDTTGGDPTMSLSMTSPCLDKPAGHTMTRSEYDSMYGSSDSLYPHDDRSKFTNGTDKPFPTASHTGPSPTT